MVKIIRVKRTSFRKIQKILEAHDILIDEDEIIRVVKDEDFVAVLINEQNYPQTE